MLTYLLKYRYKNRPLFIQSSRVQFQFTSLNFTVHKRKSVKWMYICSPKKTNSFSLVLKISYCMHIMLMITSLCNSFAFDFTATLLRMFRIIKNLLPPWKILFFSSHLYASLWALGYMLLLLLSSLIKCFSTSVSFVSHHINIFDLKFWSTALLTDIIGLCQGLTQRPFSWP